MLPPELTNTIEQFIVYVHQNEAHFTYIYVYHTNVFEADSIYKNPPPNVISHLFCYLCSLWGSTLDSVDCWSAHRSPAARDSFKRVRCSRYVAIIRDMEKKSFFYPTHPIFTTFLLVLSITKTGLYMRVSEKHGLGAHRGAC